MKNSREFLETILRQSLADAHRLQNDNYDWMRFAHDPEERSRIFNVPFHTEQFLWMFDNHGSMFACYQLLADGGSRDLFLNLIRFRMLGHLHVKLPTNTEQHWELRRAAEEVPKRPSQLKYSGMFGDIEHYSVTVDDAIIEVDCWHYSMLWTFFYKQYFYNRDGVTIQPRPGDHVINGGALFGDTGLLFAHAVGPQGRVYEFDFIDTHIALISHNLAQNPTLAPRVKLIPYAISDQNTPEGVAPVQTGEAIPGASLRRANSPPMRTIDSLVAAGEIERVDFIKFDIEGSELAGLAGAEATLRRFRPTLAISLYHNDNDLFEIPLYLHGLNLGYRFHLDHYTVHREETVLFAVPT